MQKYIFFNIPTKFLTGCVKAYFLSSFKTENKIACNNDNSKLKSKAVQKPLTANPSRKLAANKIMMALMTNKNNPNVTTVIGKVRMIKMGFKMAFKIAKTIATIIAPVKPAT